MNAFKGNRVVHEFTQTNPATPEKVFPLLCLVREDDWLPGWKYRLIYSDSGVAELGCVFTTPNPPGSAAGAPASRDVRLGPASGAMPAGADAATMVVPHCTQNLAPGCVS